MDSVKLCYEKLKGYLPAFLTESDVMNELLKSSGGQLDVLYNEIIEFIRQLSIDTATWGLEVYEKELGIRPEPNRTIAERRNNIKFKYRGFGKVDAKLIKTVADVCTNGQVDVTFTNIIKIKFNGIYGTPSNLQDLKNALEEIKPAHLPIAYTFRHLLIKDIHMVMTINEIQQRLINNFARYLLIRDIHNNMTNNELEQNLFNDFAG